MLKNVLKDEQSPFLSTACPQGINRLLWINFLFQYLYGIFQGFVFFQVRGDFVRAVNDGGVVPAAQEASDGLKGSGQHVAA